MDSNSENFDDVTVVIPCFNSQTTVQRAFNSVQNQTLPVRKIIFVDDCSADETPNILKKIRLENTNLDISILRTNYNLGPGLARNLAWDAADSKWIAFLDSDDAWLVNKNEIQMKFLSKNREVDFLSGLSKFADQLSVDVEGIGKELYEQIQLRRNLFKNKVSTRTVIMKREIPFRFSSGLSEDFKLWLTLLNHGYVGMILQTPLAEIHKLEYSKGGLSGKRTVHELYEIKAILSLWKKYNRLILIAAVLFSILKYCRRQIIVLLRIFNRKLLK